jgi:hypothetical protein
MPTWLTPELRSALEAVLQTLLIAIAGAYGVYRRSRDKSGIETPATPKAGSVVEKMSQIPTSDPATTQALVTMARVMDDMRERQDAQAADHKQQLAEQEQRHLSAIEHIRKSMQAQIDRGARRIRQLIAVLEANNLAVPDELADDDTDHQRRYTDGGTAA